MSPLSMPAPPDCRDNFARADADNFHTATPALTAAKAFFDSLLDRSGLPLPQFF